MLGAERFFSDGQRSRQEQFRLRILPLVVVERCEVVEAGRDLRMLGPERFLSDGQRSRQERFRPRVLSPLIQVIARLTQQSGSFWKIEAVLLNQQRERLRVPNQSIARL